MIQTQVILRLGYFLFGVTVQGFLLTREKASLFRTGTGSSRLMCLLLGVSKTVVCCAAAALTVWLPADIAILYTGLGLAAAVREKARLAEMLPVICTWLILYLPITGTLACLGGGLLVLAADVPEMAALAMLVLAAPMALLQFGPEGALVLLGAAVLLGAGQFRFIEKTASGADAPGN